MEIFYLFKSSICRHRFAKEQGNGTGVGLLLLVACFIFMILLTSTFYEKLCVNIFRLMLPNYKTETFINVRYLGYSNLVSIFIKITIQLH